MLVQSNTDEIGDKKNGCTHPVSDNYDNRHLKK